VRRSHPHRLSIVILVSAIRTWPGRFQARLASTDEVLVDSSRQPFVDAARALIERGYDPTSILEMKHEGSDIVALRGPLLKAARLSVEEGAKDKAPPPRTGRGLKGASSGDEHRDHRVAPRTNQSDYIDHQRPDHSRAERIHLHGIEAKLRRDGAR
jgi:hypothetical protein